MKHLQSFFPSDTFNNYTNNIALFHYLGLDQKTDALWDRTRMTSFLPYRQMLKKISNIHDWKHIIVLDSELIPFFSKHTLRQNPNVHTFAPVFDSSSQIHPYLYWFDRVRLAEKYNSYIQKLEDRPKPFFFDALLGNPGRSHKKLARTLISNSVHRDKFFLGNPMVITQASDDQFAIGAELHKGMVKGNMIYKQHISQIPLPHYCPILDDIPYLIYNKCWFSFVCETNAEFGPPYMTEKTARLLAGKRMFVAFAPRYYLQRLKDMGFRTFDTVIDESYDSEKHFETRMHKAWQQAELLCTLDPADIHKKVSCILDHNQKLLLETDWSNLVYNQIKSM